MKILNDFHTSVHKALGEIDKNYSKLPGLVICGTHTPSQSEEMIDLIAKAKKNGTPFLGICFGYQLTAIEYARNYLGIRDATSEEIEGNGTFVVRKRPQMKVGLHDGETWWSDYEVTIQFEWPENFFIVPYHPEYQSSKDKPHQVLVDFIKYAKSKK
jgi:CTP synthase (UTP-ammonia lyase)